MVEDNEREQSTSEGETEERRGLRGTLGSARQAVSRSLDRVSGTESRRQFEEFVDIVSTTVLGVHRDQTELGERFADMEQTKQDLERGRTELADKIAKFERIAQAKPATPPLVVSAFVLSVVAVVLSVIAVVIAL